MTISIKRNELFDLGSAHGDEMRTRPGRRRMPANEVRFGIKKSPSDKAPSAQIVLGPAVMEKLHWKVGDKLNVLYNDMYCVIERNNSGYWRVCKDGASSRNFVINFTPTSGKYSVIPSGKSRAKIEYDTQDDALVLAW